jgi:protein TonB
VNTLAFPSHVSYEAGAAAPLSKRFGPLAGVAALHLVMFYAIYSGMASRVVEVALPKAVYVEFVAPTQPAAAPKPVAPKVVQLAPPPLAPPPIVPVMIQTPNPNAITVPQAQPVPVEKPAAPTPVAVTVAAAPAAPAAGPRTLTTGVEYIEAPQPDYPKMSKRLGEQGKVILRVLVDEKGKANQVTVQTSSGFARLDEAGRQAALRAHFKPYMEDGRPVPVYVIVPLNFSLS